jgi:polyisoprenoid-binding protein YceI
VANPEIVFKSTNFDGNNLKGDLTLRGIAKEIKLDVEFYGIAEDPNGKTKAGFEMIEEMNRKDFDLNWSDRDRSW